MQGLCFFSRQGPIFKWVRWECGRIIEKLWKISDRYRSAALLLIYVRGVLQREEQCRLSIWTFLNLNSTNLLLIVCIPSPIQRDQTEEWFHSGQSLQSVIKTFGHYDNSYQGQDSTQEDTAYMEREIYMHVHSLHKSISLLKNICELHRPRVAVRHKEWKISSFLSYFSNNVIYLPYDRPLGGKNFTFNQTAIWSNLKSLHLLSK